MGFYYFSIFSVIPLGIAYALLMLVLGIVAYILRKSSFRTLILIPIATLFLVLPVGEELWVAWTFADVCRGAGTFIHGQASVNGFYDSTMRSGYENVGSGAYRFMEQPSQDRKTYERIERADDDIRKRAIDWYASQNAGASLPDGKSISYSVRDGVSIVVFPNGIDAWRVTRLDRPTARYHYLGTTHVPVAHKVVKHEHLVVDSESKGVLAQELSYGRQAPWFFVGLDSPLMICAGKREATGLLYRNVLIPIRNASGKEG